MVAKRAVVKEGKVQMRTMKTTNRKRNRKRNRRKKKTWHSTERATCVLPWLTLSGGKVFTRYPGI